MKLVYVYLQGSGERLSKLHDSVVETLPRDLLELLRDIGDVRLLSKSVGTDSCLANLLVPATVDSDSSPSMIRFFSRGIRCVRVGNNNNNTKKKTITIADGTSTVSI